MNADFVQAVILVLSACGCVLHTFTSLAAKRWAFRASLCAQPFWFYTAHSKGQWGIMLLAFLFAFMAGRGLWTHRKRRAAPLLFQATTVMGVLPADKRPEIPILYKRSTPPEPTEWQPTLRR